MFVQQLQTMFIVTLQNPTNFYATLRMRNNQSYCKKRVYSRKYTLNTNLSTNSVAQAGLSAFELAFPETNPEIRPMIYGADFAAPQ